MEIFEAYPGIYDCRYLPDYAKFLLRNHLPEYASEMLAVSRNMKLPLLLSLESRYTEDQLQDISVEGSKEYLSFIAANKARDQVESSMSRWIKDQLEVISRMEVHARDITLINHIRGQVMKKFLTRYSRDPELLLHIAGEIDNILLGNSTTALDIYIEMLKKTITEQSNLATKVIEASPAITFLYDVKSQKQRFVSGNVQEIMGYSPAEVTQMGDTFLTRLTHPDDMHMLSAHIQSVISENSNETRQVEYRFLHKDGMYRWLRTYEVIFRRDEQGKPLEILGKTFEISKEKEIAMSLEKREKQLLEAQSIAHLGSFEWNIVEEKSTNSDELYRIFEFDGEQRFDEFLSHVHEEDKQKVKVAIERSFVDGRYECEYRYLRNNREKVLWSIGKVEFKEGKPYRMVGTVQDITEFKRMEKELISKSHELAATNENLRHFAYVASHDMKEPLRKIMMFSDVVLNAEKEKLSERSIGNLLKMQNSSRNLYRMIEDILSFSLLETKEEPEKTSIATLVEEVIDMLEETIKEKKGRIIYGDLPTAKVVPSQFRQLLQNLIANSLKFTRAGVPPEIHISALHTTTPTVVPQQAQAYLEIHITDNGIGFPEEASEKIFELFNRFHAKSQFEGTGLGLSITKKIVENHHGLIKAIPHKDFGSTFMIIIPQ